MRNKRAKEIRRRVLSKILELEPSRLKLFKFYYRKAKKMYLNGDLN